MDNTLRVPNQSNSETVDRRREQRHAAAAVVRVYPGEADAAEVEGRLLNYSKDGFRMAHATEQFQTGQEVRFRHFRANGRAVVVWCRTLGDHCESGFLVLKDKVGKDRPAGGPGV